MYNTYHVTLLNRAELNSSHEVILHHLFIYFFLSIFTFTSFFNGPWWISCESLDLHVPDMRSWSSIVSVRHLYDINWRNNWSVGRSLFFPLKKNAKDKTLQSDGRISYVVFVWGVFFLFGFFVSTFYFLTKTLWETVHDINNYHMARPRRILTNKEKKQKLRELSVLHVESVGEKSAKVTLTGRGKICFSMWI